MSETLSSDLTTESSDFSDKTLINFLFQINQADKAKNGFFELISKRNKALLKKELGEGNLLSFDSELFAKLANEILEANLSALKDFKDFYSVF